MRSRCRCSMCPAIHINSRSWLRSSSTHEPSDPPLRVVLSFHRSACRGNSEHASTVGVRSVSAASFQSWTFELVTSDRNGLCIVGRQRNRSLNRRRGSESLLSLPSLPPCPRQGEEEGKGAGTPTTRMKRAKFGIRETAPRRAPPAGEVPFFRTNPDCEYEFAHAVFDHCEASSIMILPQVHLRKPCYDFYFL